MLVSITEDPAVSKKDLLKPSSIDTQDAKRALHEVLFYKTLTASIREPRCEVSRELFFEDPTPIANLDPHTEDDMSRPAVKSTKSAQKSTSDVKSSPKSSSSTKQQISKKPWHMMIKWENERKVKSKGTKGRQYPVLSEEVLLINSRFFELESKIDEINETENTIFLPFVEECLEWFIEGQESMCKETMLCWNASISLDVPGEKRTVLTDTYTYGSPIHELGCECSWAGSGLKPEASEMRVSLAKGKKAVGVESYATEDATKEDANIVKVKEEDPAVDAKEDAPAVKPSSRNQWRSMRPALPTSFKKSRVTFNLIKEQMGARKLTKARVPNSEERVNDNNDNNDNNRNDVESEIAVSGFIDAIVEVLETKDAVRRRGTVALRRVVGDEGSKHSEMSVSSAKKSKVAAEEVSSATEGSPKMESPIVAAKKEGPANKHFTFDDDANSESSTAWLMPKKVWFGSAEAKERAKDMIHERYIVLKKRELATKEHLEEAANIEGLLFPLTLEEVIEEIQDIRCNVKEWLQKFIAVNGSICCNASTANSDGDFHYKYHREIVVL